MPHTPGWYTQNRVLVWICALIAVNQLGFGSVVPVVPLYASAYGVSQAAIGLTIGLYGLARFLVNVPAGALAERVGRRGTLALGGGCTALGNLLCAVAPNYAAFLGARFLAGIGAAFTLTAAQIVLADISTPARRGWIMATYSGVFAFAVGIGPYPGGLLAERLGLAAPFYAFAALSLAGAALGRWRVPETRGMREGEVVAASAAPAPAFTAQLRVLLARPPFTLISLVSFGAAFARTGALFNVIPLLGRSRLGLAPDQIGLGLGLISVVGLALAYPSGALVDRFGRKPLIVPATLLTGVAMLLFAAAPSYLWFIGACAVWSVASGISSNAPGAYAADNAPPGMNAAAMSAYRMLGDLGYVVGPLLLGFVADAAGANAALGGTAVMLTIIAALFARYAPETYRATRPLPVR